MNATEACDGSDVGTVAPKIVATVVLALAAITCLGNAIFCFGVLTTRRLRTNTNCLLACISASDMLSAMLLQPLDGAYFLHYPAYPYTPKLTMVWNALFFAMMTASGYFLAAIMIDRVIAVRYCLRYHAIMTSRALRCVIGLGWCYMLVTFVVTFLTHQTPDIGVYSFILSGDLYMIILVLNLVVPFTITVLLAIYLTAVARKHRSRINNVRNSIAPDHISETIADAAEVDGQRRASYAPRQVRKRKWQLVRNEIKTLRLAIAAAVTLIILWLPFLFMNFIYFYELLEYTCLVEFIDLLVSWMTYWTSWSNLIICVTLNRDLRGIYRRLFAFLKAKTVLPVNNAPSSLSS